MAFFLYLFNLFYEKNLTFGNYYLTKKAVEPSFHVFEKIEKKGLRSGDIFRTISFERQEFLDPVAVVALQFDRIALHGSPAGKFPFHVF